MAKGYKVTYPDGSTKFVSDVNIERGTAEIPDPEFYKKRYGAKVEKVK